MSRKKKTGANEQQPEVPVGAVPPGGRWRWIGLVVVGVLLGAGLVYAWHWHGLVGRVQAALPALPDLSGKPVVLSESLAKAEALTRAHGSALAGVTEMGRLYHANNFKREAEACWRLLHAEQPHEARWDYYLADLRRDASDYEEMATLLGETVRLAPDYAPAWLRLAEYQFKTGRLDEAERGYQHRLALIPDDPYARLGLARVALQRGKHNGAKVLLEQLIKDAPGFSTGHNLYAELLASEGNETEAAHQRFLGRETGRFRDADDPWLEELQKWCYDYEHLCVLGTVEYQTAHGDRGKSFFERAIQLRPGDPFAYELLGSLYLKLNDPGKARDTLEQGLVQAKAGQPSALFYINLSRAYRDLKQPVEAEQRARLGLAEVGPQYELYESLGQALGDQGRAGEANAELQKAVELNPYDSNVNYNLALSFLNLRRLDDAMAALKRSLVRQPTFPSTLSLLSKIELDSGRWEDAIQYLQPLYNSHPEMPEARQLMARWHLAAGTDAENKKDHVAAENHFRQGLAIDRNLPELQASLGVLYLIQGRFPEAVAPLENYHRLQPANPQSALFLGQAYAATGRRDEARRTLAEGVEVAERAGNTVTAQHCREILQQLQ
jgi:tetratricopeptide (TPR) repeat protein